MTVGRPPGRRIGLVAALAVSLAGLSLAGVSSAGATTRKRVVKRVAKSFTVSLPGDSKTVAAGTTAVYPFTFARTGGFRGSVSFDVSETGPGVTARVVARSTNRYEIQMTTSPTAPTSSTVYFLQARSTSIVKSVPFRLTINGSAPTTTTAPPATTPSTAPVSGDFLLTTDAQTHTVSPGEATAYAVRIDRRSFTTPVQFTLEGLPDGARASFNPNPSQTNADLTITTASATKSGTYLLVITGTADRVVRAAAVRLVVRRTGPFFLSANPSVLRANAGNDAVTTITVGVPAGALVLPDVTLDLVGAPAGVTVQTPVTEGLSTRFVLATSSDTPAGTYRLTAVGRSGTYTKTLILTLTVTRQSVGFGLSTQPSSLTLRQGSSGFYDVTLVPIGGFAGPVSYSIAGLPTTATYSVAQTSAGVRITVATTASTTATTYPLLITGKNGVLSATVSVDLLVISLSA